METLKAAISEFRDVYKPTDSFRAPWSTGPYSIKVDVLIGNDGSCAFHLASDDGRGGRHENYKGKGFRIVSYVDNGKKTVDNIAMDVLDAYVNGKKRAKA